MEADRTVQQIPPAPTTAQAPVVRGANTIDRYSLTLQLIQVYPIVLGAVAVVLPIKWLRILVASLALLFGTLWAVARERFTERSASNVPGNAQAQSGSALDRIPVSKAGAVRGIRVDIWLHPEGSVPPPRRPHHRTYQRPVLPHAHRTGSIPRPRRHPKAAEDPEPTDGPGHKRTSQPRAEARG